MDPINVEHVYSHNEVRSYLLQQDEVERIISYLEDEEGIKVPIIELRSVEEGMDGVGIYSLLINSGSALEQVTLYLQASERTMVLTGESHALGNTQGTLEKILGKKMKLEEVMKTRFYLEQR